MNFCQIFDDLCQIFDDFCQIFNDFCQFFDDFRNFKRSLWHRSSMFGRSPVRQFCNNKTSWNISETFGNSQKESRNLSKIDFLRFSINFHEFSDVPKPKTKQVCTKSTQIQPKNANIVLNHEKKESQQHPVFPGGHPSKYWLGSMLLNFSDRTRTGVFNMIWPLARIVENFDILFQRHTCIHIQDISILWLNMPISEEKKIWLGLT